MKRLGHYDEAKCFTWNNPVASIESTITDHFLRGQTMPMIRAEFISGKSEEQKRELVEALTRETVRVLGVREEAVWIVLQEVEAENWAVGGTRLSDR